MRARDRGNLIGVTPAASPGAGPLHVDSEVGVLHEVVLHRPGPELDRLTPTNHRELLFDDVVWHEPAATEHDAFAATLRERGVVVHEFADLLAEALEVAAARDFLAEHLVTRARFGPSLGAALAELFAATDAPTLATYLLHGILKREAVGMLAAPSLLLEHLDDEAFVLPPLPNHLFQRDTAALVYDGLALSAMAKPARQGETLNARLVFGFHPRLGPRVARVLSDGVRRPADGAHATLEGGDIMVLGNRAVMVGLSERTTPQGIELLAAELFRADLADRVIVVDLPRERAFMHLDTALTMVDRDALSVFPYLDEELRSFTLHRVAGDGAMKLEENRELFPVVADALGLERLRVLRTPLDRPGAEREQWHDGNNVLAMAPGVVVGYARNVATNAYLADNGIEVVPFEGAELGRGRGGPRCLSCPIVRNAVDAGAARAT